MNGELFLTQLKQELKVDTTVWENDLLLGNPQAPLLITVACNPYCGPCAKAHKKLDELLEHHPNKIKVLLRLITPSPSGKDKISKAVAAILQVSQDMGSNNEHLQNALADWFEWMNYDKWTEKWKNTSTLMLNNNLVMHHKWIENSQIANTPTFFLNGRKLPAMYSLDDIDKLLPDLEEKIGEFKLSAGG